MSLTGIVRPCGDGGARRGDEPGLHLFIVYGRVSHLVDLSAVTVDEREFPVLPAADVNLRIRIALGRKLVVVVPG